MVSDVNTTPNLDLPRPCVLELRAGAGDKIVRYDEFAIIDLAKSLQTACGIDRIRTASTP
jgi:hypothetical protein